MVWIESREEAIISKDSSKFIIRGFYLIFIILTNNHYIFHMSMRPLNVEFVRHMSLYSYLELGVYALSYFSQNIEPFYHLLNLFDTCRVSHFGSQLSL